MTSTVLQLGFAGTPAAAAEILFALLAAPDISVRMVITQPDRRSGRGRKLTATPVKVLAQEQQLHLAQPATREELGQLTLPADLDVLVVVAYGLILPLSLIEQPRLGAINVHFSLLPRWRGAAPIQRAIQAGDQESGVSIMQMDEGLDTGDILQQSRCVIAPEDTAGTLQERLIRLGAGITLKTLHDLWTGSITRVRQDQRQATYARKVTRSEAEIDWARPAAEIARTVRAFNPSPIMHTTLQGQYLRIWEAASIDLNGTNAVPGTVVNCCKHGIDIATADRGLRIRTLQLAGKKPVSAADFISANPGFCRDP